jgi:hypothetical protein
MHFSMSNRKYIFCHKIFKDVRRNRTVLNSQITTNVQDVEGNVPENL